MSESAAPPPPPAEPPAEPPSAPPPPAQSSSDGDSSNRTVMIVLSYVWILALVPLLVEKEDKEVQWHAKHGLVLTGLEIIIQFILNVITATGIGCVFALFIPLVFLVFAVIRIICIVKGVNGERFLLPGISDFANRF